MDSAAILVATAGAFALAGFVKGVIGLGLPTVSIGLLGLLMAPAQAAAILVVPALVTNIWQAAVGGGLIALARRLWPMLAGICIGTIIGAALLPHDDSGRATVWLGVLLVLYAAFGFVKGHFAVPRHAETWLGFSWARRPAHSRWRPAFLLYRARPTSNLSSSIATNWCRRSAFRSRSPRSRWLWRWLMPDRCGPRLPGRQSSPLPRRSPGWDWDNSSVDG